MLGDKGYCYALTVTDHALRCLLLCEAMEFNADKPAFRAFERLFKERALPRAIRSDNGVPSRPRMDRSLLPSFRCVATAGHQHRTHKGGSTLTAGRSVDGGS